MPTEIAPRVKPLQTSFQAVDKSSGANDGLKVEVALTIMKPAEKLYSFWRRTENLALIIKHPFKITAVSPTESYWETDTLGGTVKWQAAIYEDIPGRLISWRTIGDAGVVNAGSVRFEKAPGDLGTAVIISMKYQPPGGRIGAFMAKFSGDEPTLQAQETLRRFKALIEAGEIPTTEGQSVGEPQRSKKKRKS